VTDTHTYGWTDGQTPHDTIGHAYAHHCMAKMSPPQILAIMIRSSTDQQTTPRHSGLVCEAVCEVLASVVFLEAAAGSS